MTRRGTHLMDIVTVVEITVTLGAEIVTVSLVIDALLLSRQRLGALAALELEVVLMTHVVETGELRVEALVAAVALVLRAPVPGGVAVLVPCAVARRELPVACSTGVGHLVGGSG